jgi:hypothetical protein
MCRHGCQRLVISILAELCDLDGQSRGASFKTARDNKRQRTASAPRESGNRRSAPAHAPLHRTPDRSRSCDRLARLTRMKGRDHL